VKLLRAAACACAIACAQGDYPLSWTQSIGAGRAYYNALGHFDETWRDDRFESQIVNAIRWVANR
jgi:uncharacterized protein